MKQIKELILITLILLGLHLKGYSQSYNEILVRMQNSGLSTMAVGSLRTTKLDTVCLPESDLKKALKKIEQGKADSAELVLRKQEIADLNVYSNQQRTSIYSLQEHVKTIEFRMLNYKEQAEIWEKALKKQKAKTILTTVAGIGVTASLVFLLVAFK